ncbi:MAG: ABC transporter ATP-binding protein [Chloroflexi bacterium HGW-Chloroflexi-6]|nr:MAG: ABC transporter ATP-binding protein [Chloroflexi bacterium HGW-Chloroflexi-6]
MSLALQTRHLTKRFGALTAVDDLSLEVRAGEIFGFLGPNGAGKTTAIQMMCGLISPDAGEVLIGGIPVRGGEAATRVRVGVCPQENILWDKLTCLEQLEFIGEAYGVRSSLARQHGFGLLEALGLQGKAHETAGKLSGGMKRRLNICLALVHDPEIVIFDEPEAGLDPQSRVLVREYIRSLPAGTSGASARIKTVILTTHNMDEAERLADRVAIIDHGKLLVCGVPDELKRSLGAGDVLELEVGAALEQAAALARELFAGVSTVNHSLVIRDHALIDRLSLFLEKLRVANIAHNEIKLRANSLEDVFLSLTGRRLRE